MDTSAGDEGVAVEPGGRQFPYAMVDEDSFAYLSTRPAGDGTVEFGVHAYGPHGDRAAAAMAEQVRIWDRDHRGGPGPDIAIWPIDTPDERLPDGAVIDKRHHRVTISWPATGTPR